MNKKVNNKNYTIMTRTKRFTTSLGDWKRNLTPITRDNNKTANLIALYNEKMTQKHGSLAHNYNKIN